MPLSVHNRRTENRIHFGTQVNIFTGFEIRNIFQKYNFP